MCIRDSYISGDPGDFTYDVTDGTFTDSGVVDITITPVNDDPTLDLNGAAAGEDLKSFYGVNGGGVSVTGPATTIADVDSTQLSSATVSLTNAMANDSLTALTSDPAWPAGITVDPSSTAPQIILTGAASLADYQTALQLVEFSNSSSTPNMLSLIHI